MHGPPDGQLQCRSGKARATQVEPPVQERRPLTTFKWPIVLGMDFADQAIISAHLIIIIEIPMWKFYGVTFLLVPSYAITLICDTYSQLQYHIIVSSFYKKLYHELFFTPSSESEPILGKNLPQVLASSTIFAMIFCTFFAHQRCHNDFCLCK